MASSEEILRRGPGNAEDRSPEFAYLCVDDFMQDIFSARALLTAFEVGLIDGLMRDSQASLDALCRQLGLDHQGFALLLGFLEKSHVLSKNEFGVQLTEEFRRALDFNDLLQVKLSMANFAAHDLLGHFTEMVRHPRQSIGRFEFCRLFAYDKGLRDTPDNYRWTKRWVHMTSTLTRYEAPVCMKYHRFGQYSRMLDIGGNSGEFLLQICGMNSRLRGTVFDLPVVCRVGKEHVAGRPEAERITFLEGDAVNDRLPSGFDLVTFKSMLHDWPDGLARQLLVNGSRALRPGGTLLIFERAPLESAEISLPFSAIPFLLFFGAFRSSGLYEEQLRDLGFVEIAIRRVELETPFHLITARKSG